MSRNIGFEFRLRDLGLKVHSALRVVPTNTWAATMKVWVGIHTPSGSP